MESQITPFANNFLSPMLCGFRRNYNTQYTLLRLIENCKQALDTKHSVSALLMDLSKAFDCLNHDLLIAKLNAYGFSRSALKLTLSYLSQRKQRVKINGTFSEWKTTSVGVPQGSVLGPLLFNIYINDMFMFISNSQICNYADDTTLYVIEQDIEQAIKTLEQDVVITREWFQNNYMKLNEEKCNLINFSKSNINTSLKIDNTTIKPSKEQKLLGISVEKNLSFKGHVESLCKKASQKLHALSRISNYMDDKQVKQMMRVFILSQFSYCPLIWMFCDRQTNNRVNRIHEKSLRLAYDDYESNFQSPLETDNSTSIHDKNLQLLLTEIFKTINNLNPCFMKEIFTERNSGYNLRNISQMSLSKPNRNSYGIESATYMGSKLWLELTNDIKTSTSLQIFKKKNLYRYKMQLQIMQTLHFTDWILEIVTEIVTEPSS